MLRDIIVNGQDAAIASFTIGSAAATGMGVVVDSQANKTVKLPAAETATDVFVLQKARIPTGINCAKEYFSDYDTEFNTFASGDHVVLNKYYVGEYFATDAYASGLLATDAGKKLSVGTDGKWKVATASTVTSKYVFCGFINDNGHQLAEIKVVEDTTANA